jgi:ATP-dependent helicase HepA
VRAWRAGELVVHRFNSDLGPGRVEGLAGRHVTIVFPRSQSRLTFAAADTALQPLLLEPGARVRVESTGRQAQVVERLDGDTPDGHPRYRLDDDTLAEPREIWPEQAPLGPLERLKALDADSPAAFANRLDGLRLERTRQARGLGSFLGGRIALFPHQLHVAERATASDPVRWLLADEVGLGKTIEACLILSRLLRTERADRALVVAPATLTVQWLGELYRKFHQTFVLLDAERRRAVEGEMGRGFNPFDAHRRAVIALEDLERDPRLVEAAARAGTDLLVVDEAHRLERRRGDRGSAAYRAVAPLTRAAEHVLLLSATPLEADAHGFFRLLELLRPEAYASEDEFLAALEAGRPLPPCTSASRRVDIGGIPPRVPQPVDLGAEPDARVAWLARAARGWAAEAKSGDGGAKSLIFVHDIPALTALKTRLEADTGRRVAIFHEELPADRRDLEVADFRRPEGPTLLISTECGGEGRNFEFCRRLVLFDLPRDPAQVEQRIGRLDRVTRRRPIEIVYFRPAEGFEAELVRLYEEIGLFREPLGGLERSLHHVEREIRKTELGFATGRRLASERLVTEVRAAVAARERAVYHHLHAAGYRAAEASGLLARVPATLDADLEVFVTGACELLGFDAFEKPGARTWYIEFGAGALVDSLAGLPGGSRFLGTFDREEAVAREELDFFASGHVLVEALLADLADGPRGRVALLDLQGAARVEWGVLLIGSAERVPAGALPLVAHEPDGPLFALALDFEGRARPEWVGRVLAERTACRPLAREDWLATLEHLGRSTGTLATWPEICSMLLAHSVPGMRLEAVAAFRLRP